MGDLRMRGNAALRLGILQRRFAGTGDSSPRIFALFLGTGDA